MTYQDADATLHEVMQIQAHLTVQDEAINVLLDKIAKLEASLAASCSGASSRTAVDLVGPPKAPGIVDAFSPSLAVLSGISPGVATARPAPSCSWAAWTILATPSSRAGGHHSLLAAPALPCGHDRDPPGLRRAMRILCVEDEPDVAAAVRRSLVAEGHAVDVVGDGLDALEWVAAYAYDLVLLDRILPGMDGVEVCRRIRASGAGTPILMFTALDQVEDRVQGLDSGADDYLPKPFAMAELLARVRALLRRDSPGRHATIQVGDLTLDPSTMGVTRAGRPVRLTAKEFGLLAVLARNPGQLFSRDRLIEILWDADFDAESNVVEVYIRSVRRKVDAGRRDGLIETVRGAGYRMRPPAEIP